MKKVFKILSIILGIIIIIGIIFFTIDYNRVKKQEKPIFCIKHPGGVIMDGGTIEYFGLGYKVIDFHTLAGFDDIKIGTWFMKYDDFDEEMKVYEEKFNTFLQEEKCFYGKVIESNTNYIIVEPNENEEIRKSADKVSIELGENNDALYMVGTNVKITYVGRVMETYPARVSATNIELKSAESFEILFYNRQPIDSYNKIYKIIDKTESSTYNYDIYAYDGKVNIKIDGKDYSLRDALLENKITMEEIIEKANEDFPNAISYDDGGSIEYHYDTYTIIKCHTLDGNRDVYIGTKDMKLNDVI